LNHGYFLQPIALWDDKAILHRAEFLVGNILEVWPALGEPPAPRTQPSTTPKALTFLGQTFQVNSWRDVAEQTTEVIIQLVDDFETYGNAFPSYLSKEPFAVSSRQLSNGWYMNVNLSGATLKKYSQRLINRAGCTVQDWSIEEVSYP